MISTPFILAISPVVIFIVAIPILMLLGLVTMMLAGIRRHMRLTTYRRREENRRPIADPLAEQISWEPLTTNRHIHCTHRLTQPNADELRFTASKTVMGKIGLNLLAAAGVALVGIVLVVRINRDSGLGPAAFVLLVSIVFSLILTGLAVFLWRTAREPIIFYLARSELLLPARTHADEQLTATPPLTAVCALQLICDCRREIRMRAFREYFIFELNLVFEGGQRLNIVNHGCYKAIRQDAVTLAMALNVPLWDAWAPSPAQ